MVGRPIGRPNNSGTSITPRRNNGNIDWDRVRDDYVLDIIEGQIAPNTSRGLMYLLKSQNILKKSDYSGLNKHLTQWRKAGLINWGDILDGSGRGVINDFSDYQSIDEFVEDLENSLRKAGRLYQRYLNGPWRWLGQPNYIEIWCEKHAIAGTVKVLVGDRYVRVAYNKGNPGWGYMHENCVRLKKELRTLRGRNIYIFYLGDADRYGRHMDIELENQLKFFSLWDKVKFERIGVLPRQIEEYNLPLNFESGEGYEVDALNAFNPQAFKKLIDDHIDPYFDENIHKRILSEHPEIQIDELVRDHVTFANENL